MYYYRDSAEYVLYNFNAQPGETWVLRADVFVEGMPCDTGSVVVDSVTTMIINNDTLIKMHTSPVDPMGVTFYMPVVERIGGLANLFPSAMCITDLPQGYGLRCYSDSTGWTYHNPAWPYSCDGFLSVDEPEESPAFSVIPDVQSHRLTLTGAPILIGAVVRVYNSSGQLLAAETSRSVNTMELNFNASTGGIYFVTVTTENSSACEKFEVTGD